MNYLFDLGHPAHFHLFKHCFNTLKKKGHHITISAKDQPVLINLLDQSGFEYINLGKKGRTFTQKVLKQFTFNSKVISIAKKHEIDIGIGISISIPQASLFCRMNSILLDDDDRKVTPLFYRFAHACADFVLSPDCLAHQNDENKYFYYQGIHELAYLHPQRFTPDPNVPAKIGVDHKEPFFILRFNAFNAYHDTGHQGISNHQKLTLIRKLQSHGKVFITGENNVNDEFQPYQISIPPWQMHDLIASATMFIGDSQTMASEAAVLGTPSIRMNSFVGKISYLEELEHKYQLTFGFTPDQEKEMLARIDELLAMPDLKGEWQRRRQRMLADKIDVTAFLVWFIENYPESKKIMSENPDYQLRFK